MPVMMLTAKGENGDEIKGLTCGADDYVRKPFDIQVLLLRIRKLCRAEHMLSCRDIRLNPDTTGGGKGRGKPHSHQDGI